MAKEPRIPELELKILQRLWDLGDSASVHEVLENWSEPDTPGYTTILKKLQIMEKKGLVRHKKAGRAYTYIARVSRSKVSRNRVNRLLHGLFGGNRVEFVNTFFNEEDLSLDEIRQVKEIIERREQEAEDERR